MHFLSLHGMGTNSQVLETTLLGSTALPISIRLTSSIATVRYEMDHIHTFDYPEGCVICPIAPGMIQQGLCP